MTPGSRSPALVAVLALVGGILALDYGSVDAELGQAVLVVDAEVVGELVEDRDPHLVGEVVGIREVLLERQAEQRIRVGIGTQSAPHSERGTPSYRPYRVSSGPRPFSRSCSGVGSSAMTMAISSSAARNGCGIPATARSTSRSNRSWRDARGRVAANREPRLRFAMAPVS